MDRLGERAVQFNAVFFDAGNTLLRPYPSVEEVVSEVFRRAGFTIDMEAVKRAVAIGDGYYEKRYWEDDTFWRSEEEAAAMWIDLYTLVAHEAGINGGGRAIAREIYDEFGLYHRWQPFPEVEGTLASLKRLGVTVGIVSNWDSRLAELCAGIGIDEHLDFVVSSAVVGRMKPQPDIFYMALARAGVTPEQALHVGDHYYADVMGARSVGITPVLVDRLGTVANPDCATVDTLCSVIDIVAQP